MSIFVHFHSLLDYFNVLLILELNSEFRDFKLWDQKTAIQRICFRNSSGIFLRDFVTLSNDFFTCEFQFIYS